MWDLAQVLGAFFLANVFDITLGGGGGFVIIPVMMLKGYSIPVAVASTWFAYLGAIAMSTYELYKKQHFHFDWSVVPFIASCSFGAIFGGLFALRLDPEFLKNLAIYVLIGMLIIWSLPRKKINLKIPAVIKTPVLFVAFFCTGIYEAMLGTGGGMILTLLLLLLTGKGLKTILSYRLVLSLFVGGVIVVTYLLHGVFDWNVALWGLVVGALGGYCGVHVFVRVPEVALKVLFYGMCFVTIGMLLVQ